MKFKILFLLFMGMVTIHSQNTKKSNPAKKPVAAKPSVKSIENNQGIFATITTTKGDIIIELEYQKTPVTVANFIALAEGKNNFITDEKLKGKPFYDGLKFHRVINDFMIQGGDPLGNGSGGPGYSFKDEFTDLKHDKPGILSMANSGPTTNGSQFFITHKETPWLDGKHTVFGHVTQGMNVVNTITQDDIIKHITIVKRGTLAQKFDAPKVFSDYFSTKATLEAEAKKVALQKYIPIAKAKANYLATTKATATTTASGLSYTIIKKGTGVKPLEGTTFFFHYAGYFEDGSLFDSSYEAVSKEYGKFDANRAAQNGYQAFPFEAGKKEGMIPGFIEALNAMSYGEKLVAFIPAHLAYGERGAGDVIPPNTTLIFELELFEKQPVAKQ